LQLLAAIVQSTVVALDPLPRQLRTDQPPPPIRPVEMTRFAPLDAAVRAALQEDAVAKHAILLVQEGLRPALLTASNPDLLAALTDLAIVTMQRYAAASQQPRLAVEERQRLAKDLAGRQVYDMQPYSDRLRGEDPQ